jgi:hypothetical protein
LRLIVVRGPLAAGPFELRGGRNTVGREPGCDIVLPSKRVSRQHCEVIVTTAGVVVQDLGSHNGLVDATGLRVSSVLLSPGSAVQVGDFVLMAETPLAPTEEDELDVDDSDEVMLEPEQPEDTPMFPAGDARLAPVSRAPASVPPGPASPVRAAPPTPPPPVPERLVGGTEAFPTPLVNLPFAPLSGSFGGGFVAPAPVAAPAPPQPAQAAPHPIAPDLSEDTPPQPLPGPAVAPPPSAAPAVAVAPRPASAPRAATGLAWAVQATLVLFAAFSVLICAPVGGTLWQASAASEALEQASLERGEQIADALGGRNAEALARGTGVALDAAFVLDRDGVRSAALTDVRGMVLAPAERLRTTVQAHPAYREAVESHTTARALTEEGTWEIVTPVRGEAAPGAGARQVVGYAILEYDPAVAASRLANPWLRGLAGLVTVGLALALVVAGGWWLVVRPLRLLREETELAVHGDVAKVAAPVRWGPLEDLAHSINRALARR